MCKICGLTALTTPSFIHLEQQEFLQQLDNDLICKMVPWGPSQYKNVILPAYDLSL